jgi:hypothetical protein
MSSLGNYLFEDVTADLPRFVDEVRIPMKSAG